MCCQCYELHSLLVGQVCGDNMRSMDEIIMHIFNNMTTQT